MTTIDPAPAAAPPSRPRQRPGALFAVLLALWCIAVVGPLVFVLWIGEQFDLAAGGAPWRGGWIAAQLYLAAAVGLPAWLAGRLSAVPRYRSTFGVWLLGAVFALCLLPARLAGPTDAQTAVALQIGGLSLYLLLLATLRRGSSGAARAGGSLTAAVAGGALLALPWAAWGALGSALDTVLNLLAALLFGLAAALTLEHKLLPVLREEDALGRSSRLLLGGLAAAALLAIMGGAFGVNGQQLILVVLLPGLGWAVARLGLTRGGWAAAALLVGLAAAAPLLLVDPDELNLTLNLGARDVGTYVMLATVLGALLGGLLSLAALLPRAPGRRAAALVALAAVAGVAVVYFLIGQPGWHGERLYVVLKDQADVAAAVVIDDPVERRTVVYDLLTQHADTTQIELRRALDRWGVAYRPYYLVNALEVDGGPLWRWWLLRRPEVERVLVSPELRPLPAQHRQWPRPVRPVHRRWLCGHSSASTRRSSGSNWVSPARASSSARATPVWTERTPNCATSIAATPPAARSVTTTTGSTRGTTRPRQPTAAATARTRWARPSAEASAWPPTRRGSPASTCRATWATRRATSTASSFCWPPSHRRATL
jgi:hypothetical protein